MGKISVIIKEPGKKARRASIIQNITNLEKYVGGEIERYLPKAGGVMIVNNKGAVNGMEYSATIDGIKFYGTILWQGIEWKDAKAACPEMFEEISSPAQAED